MKEIEISEEDLARLESFGQELGFTVPELLSGIAGIAAARTSKEALKALLEAHVHGTSWYLLRQTA